MAAQESLQRKLAQVGHAPPGPPEDNRKREIMARLFGDTSAPARIGRFIDLGLLGHGAMGTVRRAYDEQVAREVAIKLVRNRSSRKRHDRLLREAQALGQLSHPNVVQVFEAGEIARGPVAKIGLPRRICVGTHACWASAAELARRND